MSAKPTSNPELSAPLAPGDDFERGVERAANDGYAFVPDLLTEAACQAMEAEVEGLELRPTDWRHIKAGTKREITQSHDRHYVAVGHESVPVATMIADALRDRVHALSQRYPELAVWQPTEAGYQRYAAGDGHISPHRDSATDELLGVTITVNGSAPVRIYDQPPGDPQDYTDLSLAEEFRTRAGSVMLLRSKGFGSGERIIHEALPPEAGSRLVLNLRMRPDVVRSDK